MRIEDIRINHKFVAPDGTVHEAKAVGNGIMGYDGEIVIDENGNAHAVSDVEPFRGEPYLKTDKYGHTSFCVDSPQGTYAADIDTRDKCGYNRTYLSFIERPSEEEQEEQIFEFCVLGDARNDDGTVSDDAVRLMAFTDVIDDEPTVNTTYTLRELDELCGEECTDNEPN